MRRTFLAKVSVLSAAAFAALLLTIYQPSPKGLMPFGVGQAEVRAAPGTTPSAYASGYKLEQLKIINLTLQKIHDNYVDPTRIDSGKMLLAMLDSVQRNVPEVLVEPAADGKSVTLQVNDKRKTFDISDVGSPWRLHAKMKEIFRFIQANMNPASDPAQIEYAAVNGLLSTLDPHSVLLDPEQAREMDINTSGKFGGIGIVIGMRKGQLTVIQLIDKTTPAAKSGLKANDAIMTINDEPTANMTLTEAMNRLRGDPNTTLTVTIQRKGEDKPRSVQITRDVIRISSVEGRLLSGNVGYLKLKTFSSRTYTDLRDLMQDLKKKGAKAWVLDLRWNPGGLLDQAIQVADAFLSQGTIVTTVGFAGKQRDEKRASHLNSAAATDPLVVLVNAGSASASEIVAGALKNLNRAVIVGETTFGKGSVQILFGNDDGSKLKLTIAQYLTPGDISIQSVGIPPDIELVPLYVPEKLVDHKEEVRIRGVSRFTREADLDSHLTSKNAREAQKPSARVRYIYEPPPGQENATDEDDDEQPVDELEEPVTDPDRFVEDFPIKFGRELVASAGSVTRTDTLKRAEKFIARYQTEEENKLVARLSKLGIDWTTGPKSGEPRLVATFKTDKPGNQVNAGDVIAVTGTVENKGTGPAYRVAGFFETDDWVFEDRELLFGKVEPGKSVSFTTFVKVPQSSVARMDRLDVRFESAHGTMVEAEPLRVVVTGLPRPQFAYAYQLVDEEGNGDGLVQPGEKFKLKVKVRNQGEGKSYATTAILRNASGDAVVVYKGRYELKEVPPGQERDLEFTFDVKKKLSEPEIVLELSVYDSTLHEGVNEKLKFRVRNAGAGPAKASGQVVMNVAADVHEGAAPDTSVIGTAKKGAVFKVTGKDGEWTRVDVGGRPGFVPTSAVKTSTKRPSTGGFVAGWQVTPPKLVVARGAMETRADKITLSGKASDDTHVEDVFVLVSNRDSKIDGKKVFYRSNRGSKADKDMAFDASVPLWPGNNLVTVVARENNDVRSMYTLYIHRSPDQAVSKAEASSPPAPAPAPR